MSVWIYNKALDTYDLYHKDNLSLFERYDLYELTVVEIINGQLQNFLVSFVLADDKDKEEKMLLSVAMGC